LWIYCINCGARKDYANIVKLLIVAGLDINTQNKYGYTALMWVVVGGYKEIVKLLIKAGLLSNK